MRKIISCILLTITIFNFILCNKSYAADSFDIPINSTYLESNSANPSNTAISKLIESGTATQGGGGSEAQLGYSSSGNSGVGTVAGILARLVNIVIALQVDVAMGLITHNDSTDVVDDNTVPFFSIDRAVFNRVALFNINYFKTGSYNVGETTISESDGNTAIKESVTRVYYICRIVALALSLLVLIYIGIRMAISTVASDQARYKKMLISWVESIIILFVMLYLISFIILIGEKLTEVFYGIRNTLLSEGEEVFEEKIRSLVWPAVFSKSGFDLAIWSIIYWCLLFIEFKFFCTYARRFLMVGLLIAVSPLIIITYSMDKAGDGRAQVFSNWIKKFIICVLIQPLHALIYLIFVFTANTIASSSPLIAIAILFSMTTVERMVRVIFNMNGSEIIREMKFFKKGGK